MPRHTRRTVLLGLGVALAGCSSAPPSGGGGGDAPAGSPLNRFAITAGGAEVTGLFLGPDETLFMNVQHPSDSNTAPYDDAAVGVFSKPLTDLPTDFESVELPAGTQSGVSSSWGRYRILAQQGETTAAGEKLGVAYTPDGTQLTTPDRPDGNVYVPVDSATGYLYTNWETTPGTVSRLCLERPTSGDEWRVTCVENLDVRSVAGTWHNCFATRSPWGTPLSSEELFYQDTAEWNSPSPGGGVSTMERYLGEYPNPYRYGYVVEIQDAATESPTPVKQFALGRFAHETAVVMPDERTVYLSDDGDGTVLFKFVADSAGDLSAGTLYAARAMQDSGSDLSKVGFDIEWLELAHAAHAEIESWIAEYDDVTPDDYRSGATSYVSDAEIRAWANGDAADDRAAFLESRKAAEAVGATAEFRKMEGVNVRADAQPGDYLYVAMSRITRAMADDSGDVQLPRDDYGAVYRLQLDADYDVTHMEPAVVGGPNANVCGGCPYDARPNSGDVCANCSYNPQNEAGRSVVLSAENTVANPDNLVVMGDGRVVVGEDTDYHDNDMVWVYDPSA